MMKRKHFVLAVLAIILVLSIGIGAASAYFTSYATAQGGYVIHLGHESEIHESVDGTVKSVQIQNIADSEEDVGKFPIFVRAKVYHGSDCTVTVSGSGWTKEGDLYYYEQPLYADLEDTLSALSTTSVLTVDAQPTDPSKVQDGDVIDVIITYDSVPAVFDKGGNPQRGQSWANQDAITDIAG